MIASNLGLVHNQLKRYHLTNDPDAESIAYEALYRAIISYDEARDIKLSTYATVFIYNGLGDYVRHLKRKRQLYIMSYNSLINEDGDEFIDLLSIPNSIENEIIAKENSRELDNLIDKLYMRLSNQTHKNIVGTWRASNFGMTSTSIAKEVGVSQSYVSQVLSSFRGNLREKLKESYYD